MIDDYKRMCDEPSDINEHLPTFVDLCVELNAAQVIELGVRSGVSTTAWLYGLEQTDGHLWSVDIDGRPKPNYPPFRWTFIQGDDLDPEVLARLPLVVDVVFIDTLHTYEQTYAELTAYVPKVRSGGRVLLHDSELEHPEAAPDETFPVKAAVQTYCDEHGLMWSNVTKCYGLATIYVR